MSVMHILYVEDHADIRGMVLELIEGPGRRVVACADAESAWQHLEREAFDVLVTDVNLPGESGTQLARRWLDGQATRWVVLFSGADFPSELGGIGARVRAIRKEAFEQLDPLLTEIGQQLLRDAPRGG